LNELLGPAYRNAHANSGRDNARIEHDKALSRVLISLMKDDTELFRQYSDNDGFKRWLTDTVFGLTYGRYVGGAGGAGSAVASAQ